MVVRGVLNVFVCVFVICRVVVYGAEVCVICVCMRGVLKMWLCVLLEISCVMLYGLSLCLVCAFALGVVAFALFYVCCMCDCLCDIV